MKRKIAICLFVLCVVPSVMVAQQVSVNYNHNANFSQYHTYAWGSNNKNAIANSILAQVAQQDIDTLFAFREIRRVMGEQEFWTLVFGEDGKTTAGP